MTSMDCTKIENLLTFFVNSNLYNSKDFQGKHSASFLIGLEFGFLGDKHGVGWSQLKYYSVTNLHGMLSCERSNAL